MTAVYVAGSSGEIERAEGVIASLRAAGCRITLDWPAAVRKARAAGFHSDAALPDGEAEAQAMADLEAVATADYVLLLAPSTPTRGAWVELGYAFGCGKRTIVSGPEARASIFTRCAGTIYDTDAEAIAALRECAREDARGAR